MPKSKVRPAAAAKKKALNKLRLENKKLIKDILANRVPVSNQTYPTNSLVGAVKSASIVSKPMYHNRKSGGE